MPPSRPDDIARQVRRDHPLIQQMKRIRKHHRVRLVDAEACMELPTGTLKQIEEGRRPLPQLISSDGLEFAAWFQNWLRCVRASADERDDVEESLMLLVLGRFKRDLP